MADQVMVIVTKKLTHWTRVHDNSVNIVSWMNHKCADEIVAKFLKSLKADTTKRRKNEELIAALVDLIVRANGEKLEKL